MRPVFLCVSWITLLCCMRKSDATLGDFFNNVGHAFNVAWTSLTDSIKKPVRMKRLGYATKRQTTVSDSTITTAYMPTSTTRISTTTPTSATEALSKIPITKPTTRSTTVPTTRPTTELTTTGIQPPMPVNNKTVVTLPLLTTPKFKNLMQWRDMQKPQFAKDPIQNSTVSNETTPIVAPVNNQVAALDVDDLDNFGPLLFI